jgi:hypothetical protein
MEKFLMPILAEEAPDDMLFQKDRHLHNSGEMDWQGWAYHLPISFT